MLLAVQAAALWAMLGPGLATGGLEELHLDLAEKEGHGLLYHDLDPRTSAHHRDGALPPLFQVGSGAQVGHEKHVPRTGASTDPHTLVWDPYNMQDHMYPNKNSIYKVTPRKGSTTSLGQDAKPTLVNTKRLKPVVGILPLVVILILLYMMPQQGGGGARDFNYRIPPAWSPEMESSYSFRAYMTDLSLWIMLTDLLPHQQTAAIILRLGGAAKEMARMISPQEMVNGGAINGVQVDLVTYLLAGLHTRFAALEEESRLSCMTEMLAFARKPGENINAVLARYETVRTRAAIEGQFVMSAEGCSLQLLRACGIQSQHLITLLQPFNGRLPNNDLEFNQMCTQLRRFGHISEGAEGNIAQALHGSLRQARPGSYLTGTE